MVIRHQHGKAQSFCIRDRLNRRYPVIASDDRVRAVLLCLRNQALIDPVAVLHAVRYGRVHDAARPFDPL